MDTCRDDTQSGWSSLSPSRPGVARAYSQPRSQRETRRCRSQNTNTRAVLHPSRRGSFGTGRKAGKTPETGARRLPVVPTRTAIRVARTPSLSTRPQTSGTSDLTGCGHCRPPTWPTWLPVRLRCARLVPSAGRATVPLCSARKRQYGRLHMPSTTLPTTSPRVRVTTLSWLSLLSAALIGRLSSVFSTASVCSVSRRKCCHGLSGRFGQRRFGRARLDHTVPAAPDSPCRPAPSSPGRVATWVHVRVSPAAAYS